MWQWQEASSARNNNWTSANFWAIDLSFLLGLFGHISNQQNCLQHTAYLQLNKELMHTNSQRTLQCIKTIDSGMSSNSHVISVMWSSSWLFLTLSMDSSSKCSDKSDAGSANYVQIVSATTPISGSRKWKCSASTISTNKVLKKRSISYSTYLKWKMEFDKEYQTITWFDCDVSGTAGKKIVES